MGETKGCQGSLELISLIYLAWKCYFYHAAMNFKLQKVLSFLGDSSAITKDFKSQLPKNYLTNFITFHDYD